MDIGARIREKRERASLTLEEVAKQIDISRQTLSRYETGVIQGIPLDKVEALAKVLDTTPAYLMGWEQEPTLTPNIIPMPKIKKVPLLGDVACGKPKFAEERYGEFAEVETDINCDFALLANGDSMVDAGIQDGYVVFIRKQDTVDNGEIAAVILDDEATLKRVRRIPGNMVMLEACNSAYEPIFVGGEDETRTIRILGKAVAFQGYL